VVGGRAHQPRSGLAERFARRAGENWHSDICYASRLPRGTMLYALEIPELFGLALGDTEFASTAAAWDALPERMRRHLDLFTEPLWVA
jgi:alpha-ketoglutarate-dependent taurine dioxygenase